MSALATTVLRERDAIAALAPAWADLWRRSPSATPFQSPAWLLPWWDSFAPGTLRVVTVHCGDRLVALAPLYREAPAEARPEGHAPRRLLPIGLGTTDYLDVLIDPDTPDAAARLVDAAAADRDWDEWELTDLAPGAAAITLPVPPGCTETVDEAAPCPVLALPAGADDIAAALPPRKRRAIRMDRNRASRRGAVEIVTAHDEEEVGRLLAVLITLHQARWTARGEPGVFADARVRDFHERALPGLLAAGLVRLDAVTIAGAVAAVMVQLVDCHRRYAYLAGFDAAFAYESPGTLLFAAALEDAARAGVREFHFLRGDEPYKRGWGAVVTHSRRRLFRRTETQA